MPALRLSLTEASDGDDAIARLNEQPFDAVVLDIMMPRVNGFEVLAYMREHDVGGRCVILASAAAPTLRPEDAALVTTTIQKPFNLQDLLAAVRECLEAG